MKLPRWMSVTMAHALIICSLGSVSAQDFVKRLPAVMPPMPSINQHGLVSFQEPVLMDAAGFEVPVVTAIRSDFEPGILQYALNDLEALALSSSPAICEAISRIEAAKGRSLQVSLPPNPTVGYVANEIGNAGSAGQHGAYVGRRFVRGGKLQWNRAVECREVQRLTKEYEVVRQRILTDVRAAYYSLLGLQRQIELLNRVFETNKKATLIAEKLFAAGENTKNDVLLLELECEQTATDLVGLEANKLAKWRGLTRLVGETDLEQGQLLEPASSVPHLSWEDAVALMQQSPMLASTEAEVARHRAALQRAMVERIPDLNTQFSLQYDFATDDTLAGVQIGVQIPKWDRNQGGIYEANANVRAAMQKVDRIRLSIEQELAAKFGAYENARKQLLRIDQVIVPKAEEVVRIALEAYAAGEASMADVLNAQRSLLRSLVRQLNAKQQLRLSYTAIEGFLLSDGLNTT